MSPPAGARDHLDTERPNPRAAGLDALPLAEAFDRIQAEDAAVPAAVAAARGAIVRTVELASERLARGGRLFYVGAGTSGRLGALDAAECPPTFRSRPEQVQAVLAGGARALVSAVEGAEDDERAAGSELDARGLGADDLVLGIAAGGTTPFVHAALRHARARGAATAFLACVPFEQAPDEADVSIRVLTGPEVVSGSTRMKAGTATKLVLNLVSTLVFVRLGKVYDNLMVDVDTGANAKLWERGVSLVQRITGAERAAARGLLEAAGGSVKRAAVMGLRGCDARAAGARLAASGGNLRAALADGSEPA